MKDTKTRLPATVRRHAVSGQWYGRWRDGHGKHHHEALGRDRAKAQARLDAHKAEAQAVRRGDTDPEDERRRRLRNRHIDDQIDDYETTLKSRKNGGTHCGTTIAYIRDFVGWVNRNHVLVRTAGHIDRTMVEKYVAAIQGGETARVTRGSSDKAGHIPANRTINARVGAVQEFLKDLKDRHVLSEYVLARFPKLPIGGEHAKRKPRALDKAEQLRLVGIDDADRRDLYEFCLLTGARHSAAQAFVVGDADFEKGVLRLKGKRKPNSRRSPWYTMPMTPACRVLLARRCEGRAAAARVFAVPNRGKAAKLLRRDCKVAGIATTAVMFHSLRHSFCTSLARAGVHPAVLQRLADHAEIATTLGYYVHWTTDDDVYALAKAPMAGRTPPEPKPSIAAA